MGATIHDVAREAQVSISTVSRVLNDTSPVHEDKRERVEAAARKLGYTPNPAARSLLKQETGALGVLLPFVGGEFFSDLLNGIDQATQENELTLLISASHRSAEDFARALHGLYKRVDGLIIMSTEVEAEEVSASLPENVPVVFINTKTKSEQFDVINFDNFDGAYRIAEHLIERGHQRIAMIKGPAASTDALERLQGYQAALREHSITPDPSWEIEGDFTQAAGYAAVAKALALDPRPTALLAANDYCAIGALHALREASVAVPDEMAVAGFDDITSAGFTSPPLSSVRVPLHELGVRAVERLVARLQHGPDVEAPPQQLRLPVELVLRATT